MPTEAPPAPPPSPNAAPSPPAERAPSEFMADIESDFADMDAGKPPPEPTKKAAPAKAPEKPASKEPEVKPPEKAEEKPEEKAPEKPAETPPEEKRPTRMRELGEAYDNLKKRIREEYEPQIQSLKAKVQEFETKKPDETGPVLAKLTALEKRNAELEQHIAYVDYAESTEFKSKYSEPYAQAWTDAVSEFRELTVRQQNGQDEDGNPTYAERPADENDLLSLANMKLSDMDKAANAMFGPSAARAINHVQNIRKLSAAQNKALAEAKTKSAEWKSTRQLQAKSSADAMAKTWLDINKSLEEKFPKAFKVEEGDAEDKASHTKGFALADLMFVGAGELTPEQIEALPSNFRETVKAKKPLTDAQRVQLHALARLKMANHDRKVAALKKAQSRIAELEKALAEYEQSEPGAGKTGGAKKISDKPWDEQIADEIKALDK